MLLIVVDDGYTLHAHPGRTAGDGCHYCRTNCDSWGIAWNERHCHGGSAPVRTAPVQSAPAKPAVPAGTLGQGLEATTAYAVVEVVDGDTIKVRDTDGRGRNPRARRSNFEPASVV